LAGKGSAAKRHRQSLKARLRNRMIRSNVRSKEKSILNFIKIGDAEAAENTLKEYVKAIDTAAGKGVYHQNAVARKKSRLHSRLKNMSAK
jgi:small subunit ribosomal protein S20